MKQITSYEQFQALRRKALVEHKLKQTNYLYPDSNMHVAISKGKVTYDENDDCLLVSINRHGFEHLYYWLTDVPNIICPDKSSRLFLSCFGTEGQNNIWEQVANKLMLSKITTALEFSAKADDVVIQQNPMLSQFEAHHSTDLSYEDYIGLISPFFNVLTDAIETDWEWENNSKDVHVLTATCNDEFAGIICYNDQGSRRYWKHVAVAERFRKMGVLSLLREPARNDCKTIIVWIHEWNSVSLKNHLRLGVKPDGRYSTSYSNEAIDPQHNSLYLIAKSN